MFKHILVPTDGSTLSLKAARTAGTLAAKLKARVTLIYVRPPYQPPMSSEAIAFQVAYTIKEHEAATAKAADKALARAATAANAAAGRKLTPIHVHPWEAIIAAAKKERCDLIVMASHGRRGLAGILLGSETQKVLTHSKTPVLVCR
jgi:nucleotide-binding universal stress UspA family protein